MDRRGNNKNFEELFKKFFPRSFENAQRRLGKTQQHDPNSFFEDLMNKGSDSFGPPKDENGNVRSPDEIQQTNQNGKTIITKTWYDEDGGKTIQQQVYKQGSGFEEDNKEDWNNPDLGMDISDLSNLGGIPTIIFGSGLFGNQGGDDFDEDIFKELFGASNQGGNQFSFSDPVGGDPTNFSLEQLQKLEKQAIENEEYEEAAKIRDVINKRSSSSS